MANHNWKGGITPMYIKLRQSPEYKAFRTAVFERDDYVCQDCSQRGGKLSVDHIKPFAFYEELRYVLSNGRTLCWECHKKTPTFAGRAQKYQKGLEEFIRTNLNEFVYRR